MTTDMTSDDQHSVITRFFREYTCLLYCSFLIISLVYRIIAIIPILEQSGEMVVSTVVFASLVQAKYRYACSKIPFCSCGLCGCQLWAVGHTIGNRSSRNCGTKKSIRSNGILHRIQAHYPQGMQRLYCGEMLLSIAASPFFERKNAFTNLLSGVSIPPLPKSHGWRLPVSR